MKPGLGSRSFNINVFGPLEPEPLEKKIWSRSRSKKNSGAVAGAAKKRLLYRLLEDKKHMVIGHLLLVLYFLRFYISSSCEKKYFANWKKSLAGAAWKKNQEPEPQNINRLPSPSKN